MMGIEESLEMLKAHPTRWLTVTEMTKLLNDSGFSISNGSVRQSLLRLKTRQLANIRMSSRVLKAFEFRFSKERGK